MIAELGAASPRVLARELGARWLAAKLDHLERWQVEEAHALGRRVIADVLHEGSFGERLRRALALGVDGVQVDLLSSLRRSPAAGGPRGPAAARRP